MPARPEDVVRRLIEEGFNEGNLDVADEIVSPDLIEHQNFGPDHAPGPGGVKAVMASLRRAFSDFHLAIEDLAVDGDTVWLRMTGTGPMTVRSWGIRLPAAACAQMSSTPSGSRTAHRRALGRTRCLGTLFQLGLAHPPARASTPAATTP